LTHRFAKANGHHDYSLCRNGIHDRRNGQLIQRDLRHLLAIAHDNDPIGITHQLFQLGRDDQQRQTVGAQGFNQADNFGVRADVNAAGRFIEDQELRFGQQPAGSSTFCWLPPERNSIGCSALGVRIPSWRIKRSAMAFCSLRGSAAASRAAPAAPE
jgi:hypothetical protein